LIMDVSTRLVKIEKAYNGNNGNDIREKDMPHSVPVFIDPQINDH